VDNRSLKQAEIFAFLAALFLIGIMLSEKARQDNPPIIVLSEEDKSFRFQTGSATVPDAFVNILHNKVIPQINQLSKQYHCDLIEIVGHTDGAPVINSSSNLDYANDPDNILTAGSNTDLGMMRALNIMKILNKAAKANQLKNIKHIHPYSAGQMILPNQQLALDKPFENNSKRRRIEIRLLRSHLRRTDQQMMLATGSSK